MRTKTVFTVLIVVLISCLIAQQVISGEYYLLAECHELSTNKTIVLSKLHTINGLEASLSSDTDEKVYFKEQLISILTNITNLDGDITNGILNLKIAYPYVEESP